MVDTGNPVTPRRDTYPSALEKLSPGDTFTATLRTFRQSPWKFVGLLLLPLPLGFVAGVGQALMKQSGGAASVGLFSIFTLLQYVVTFIVQGAIVWGAWQILEGGRFSFGDALGVGARRLLAVVGFVILASLLVLLGALVFIPAGIFMAAGSNTAAGITGAIGLIVFFVYATILFLMLAVALPACVIERIGPIKSMRHSRVLTKDNRWRILGAMALIFLPALALYTVAFILLVIPQTVFKILGFIVLIVGGVALGAMFGTFPSVLFYKLRAIKEGARPGQVSCVFD